MMTSRERVLCALNHEEPDRVPIFFGASGATTMVISAYDQLKRALGVTGQTRIMSRFNQYAMIDEEVWKRLPSDGRPLLPGPAPSVLAREISPEEFVDGWGVIWRKNPDAPYYEANQAPPLQNATIDDLAKYPWPKIGDPSRFLGLAEQARAIQQKGFAVVAVSGATLFEQIQFLRGLDTWLMDLAEDPEFAHAMLRRMTDMMKGSLTGLLDAAGKYIDVVIMADDMGWQNGPFISPAMYRTMYKAYHAELIATIRSKSKAKVFFHSDGNVLPLLNDLIDVGVDLLNPVQVSAKDMGDTARLKREFGDRLSFCGAIDTQRALPYGTTDDVRREVRRRIKDLAPGGGYICAAVHSILADVPVENLYAMFDEVMKSGTYPLSL